MNPFIAGVRLQVRLLRRSLDNMLALVTAPMMTLVFLAITRHAGRTDLAPYAVLAPALIALWSMALLTAGEVIANERDNGSLEILVAAPSSVANIVAGRILAVTLVSLAGFGESWLVAWLVFQVAVPIAHPVALVATVTATALAMAGTASIMSAVFVLTRSARTFQNSLSYPFYILGGVIVPVTMLPVWLRPLSRLVFLSWSSDLLRECLTPVSVPHLLPRLGVVLGLGIVGHVVGVVLVRLAADRLRETGSMGHA